MNDFKHINRTKKDRLGNFMAVIGLIGLVSLAYSVAREPYYVPLTQRIGCRECHKAEVPYIKSVKEYSRYHRYPTVADKHHKQLVKAQEREMLMELVAKEQR